MLMTKMSVAVMPACGSEKMLDAISKAMLRGGVGYVLPAAIYRRQPFVNVQ